ncbi:putative gustatory receptor 28b [Phymastichus coffea]|uniref:putative gustatory receptor 28b n=1 Tax=Phymastichus coffea TaxID=108790 RepID=UPI00273BCA07|nr:putative gustatory receptor 28b [Phymastichus coffea]
MFVKSLFYYFKFLGMATMTFHKDINKRIHPTTHYIISHSKFGITYNLLLLSYSKQTGKIVNDFLADGVVDQDMIKKLSQFSYYIVNSNVEFKVFKLFSLDQSLLTSLVGTCTTYLVIILQFQ